MLKVYSVRLLIIAILIAGASVPLNSQKASSPTRFVIDTNREFVYLKFDHMGKGIRRGEDEPDTRLWLRFVNNCNVPVNLRTFGVPEGSPRYEIGVMDEVVEDKPFLQIVSDDDEPEPTSWPAIGSNPPTEPPKSVAKPPEIKQPESMPTGYWFEVGSLMTLRPGQEVLFSIPINQLAKKWHIEIPFEFEVPKGKVPRDPKVGGEPETYLSYSLYDLPDDVRSKIGGQESR
jgi:hypothetical protein